MTKFNKNQYQIFLFIVGIFFYFIGISNGYAQEKWFAHSSKTFNGDGFYTDLQGNEHRGIIRLYQL